MNTIINNPTPTSAPESGESTGAGIILGVIIAIILFVLFIIYGLPALRNTDANTNTDKKDDVNINVTIPAGSKDDGTDQSAK